MPKSHIISLGKVVRKIAQLRGGGSALPGLVIEKIDPMFTRDILSTLPYGVVIVSGTNGKTTTTKVVVELLESQGLKVFTNRTGSNFVRGVIAAILGEVDLSGKLDADIAVLELDEAHAVKFVDTVPPKYSLLLNVMRDQLDRFGEIDATAKMLEHIASKTTSTVVLNREDERVARIASTLPDSTHVEYFGLSKKLLSHFPSDDDMMYSQEKAQTNLAADVILDDISDNQAIFTLDNKKVPVELKLNGVYNMFNAAAALTLVRSIVTIGYNEKKLFEDLSTITPAFGRGESLIVNGQPLELILVKNPSGFRLALSSFPPEDHATMIAINDNYADGRDMSWLWDVDFASLKQAGISHVSGVRAYDMALRLQYDTVEIAHVEPSLDVALEQFLSDNPDTPKRIFCTYTAMLKLRKLLANKTEVEKIL